MKDCFFTNGQKKRKIKIIKPLILVFCFCFAIQLTAQQKGNNYWTDATESSAAQNKTRDIFPLKYRTLSLDIDQLKLILNSLPAESSVSALQKSNTTIILPLPDGTEQSFYVYDSPIMESGLATRYPEIRTFSVRGTNSSLYTGRIDYTLLGFHAILFTPQGEVYIDPYQRWNDKLYMSYYKADFYKEDTPAKVHSCVVDNPAVRERIEKTLQKGELKANGDVLRKYRLALATTGEYAAFYGGTVAGTLSGMVTSINRVDGVYEKELAIRMVLISNTDKLICTNASKDPFTNNDGEAMLEQNQNFVDSVIGSTNYDFGHVFSTGGGGIAYLGVICNSSLKAQGVTGSPAPIGDPYDIDYVAHEMGHQFGANHPFNGSTGSCSGGNRNAGTAYEPGSGSTIMAYAGICSPQDLQAHSDDYFHIVSINEITAYTTGYGEGYGCAATTSTGNAAPSVTVGMGNVTIPVNTPFALTGSASDAQNDSLTYCWEEYDLGPAGSPNSPSGNAPIFRSFNPVSSPTRIFPQLSDLLNNKHTIGELLPTYTRSLTFRLSVRDNKGGIGSNLMQLNVTQDAGPFTVTYPNANISWAKGSKQTITWNVANTNVSPVNCANVNIYLSTDGGNTFPTLLAKNTPNDGSEEILVPNTASTTARVKVEAADNIFFDISNANFTISDADVPVELTSFKVVDTQNGVKLAWETATEVNNSGFYVERSLDGKTFQSLTFVPGKGTTTLKSVYSYTDNISGKTVYYYRLKQVDNDGTFKYSNIAQVSLSTVYNFALEQNYPNPFNPTTTIKYTLQVPTRAVLKVFNALGKEVAVLVNKDLPAGNYNTEFNAASLASGMYFYELTTTSGTITRKMLIVK